MTKTTSVEGRVDLNSLRRHRLAERLLFDVVGIDWENVHRAASGWEAVISAEVERRLVELLGDPATCPHGNPIPGSRRRASRRPTIRLAAAPPGPVTVARIEEELEDDDEALRMLAAARLIPGCGATVLWTGAAGVLLRTPAAEQLVPRRVATLTWVTPAPPVDQT